MRRLPNNPKYSEFQKLSFSSVWFNGDLNNWIGGIILSTSCSLMWNHFEMIRLSLAWNLGSRSSLSNNERYNKNVIKRNISSFFNSLRSNNRVTSNFWYTGFPHILVSNKVQGGSMGNGKGSVKTWYYLCHEGRYLLVISGPDYYSLFTILHRILTSLPASGYIVIRQRSLLYNTFKTSLVGSSWWR